MFSPQRTVIETRVDYGARISVLEASHPGKSNRIFAFEKLSEHNRAHLLKGFREIAFKVLREMFPFALFDCITAKLDHLKIIQVFYLIHSFVLRILVSLSKCRDAERNQYNYG